MDLDVERLLGAVERTVSSLERDGQAARAGTLACSYVTTVEDLWDPVTNAERIPRWFLPVSGRSNSAVASNWRETQAARSRIASVPRISG